MCAKTIARSGCGVISSKSGAEALALLPVQESDCVLTDIHMAGAGEPSFYAAEDSPADLRGQRERGS